MLISVLSALVDRFFMMGLEINSTSTFQLEMCYREFLPGSPHYDPGTCCTSAVVNTSTISGTDLGYCY